MEKDHYFVGDPFDKKVIILYTTCSIFFQVLAKTSYVLKARLNLNIIMYVRIRLILLLFDNHYP